MHNAVAQMDGEVHFVRNHLINAKVNRVIMVVRVNRDRDGFVACAHKDFRGRIVGSMWMNAHRNRVWVEQRVRMVSVAFRAFVHLDEEENDVKFVSVFFKLCVND